ncbi:MAG TPA: GntR family transcriptional regulator [Tissierellia bacterium]|jgi:GntR family transcriptional regulator|nr:GntR family transcriptional regulator [Tissierellia bacterium]
MSYPFNNEQPIYLQLIDIFKQKFVRAELIEGDQLPSVRDVALLYGVNPNTVQKAFSELDREGLTRSERTSGRFVIVTKERRKEMQEDMAKVYVEDFLEKMDALGIQKEEIYHMIRGENDEHSD